MSENENMGKNPGIEQRNNDTVSQRETAAINNAKNSVRLARHAAGKTYRVAKKGADATRKVANLAGNSVKHRANAAGGLIKAGGTAANVIAPGVGTAAGMIGGGAVKAGGNAIGTGIKGLGNATRLLSRIPVLGKLGNLTRSKEIGKELLKRAKSFALKFGIVLFIIVGLIWVVFFAIESLKEGAYEYWDAFIKKVVEQIAPDAALKGYRSTAAGLDKESFDKVVESILNAKLPQDDEAKVYESQTIANEISTDQERKRLTIYFKAERDSILKAPNEESFFQKFTNFFSSIFGDQVSGNSKRLFFTNDEQDFEELENRIEIYEDGIAVANTIEDHINVINSSFKSDEDYMKNITDKTLGFNGGMPSAVDYPMEDKLFRQLDPYALPWDVLYFIDKAIDEDEFEDFGAYQAIIDGNLTDAQKEELEKTLRGKFILQAIPSFMPEFTTKRHLRIEENRTSDEDHSLDEEGECESDNSSTRDTTVIPMYTLEKVDKWDQTIITPSAERTTIEETWEYSKCSHCGDILVAHTYRKVIEPYPAPSGEVPTVDYKETQYIYGKERPVSRHYEKIEKRNASDKTEIIPKPDNVKNIFIKIYGEEGYETIKYDIEHALYLVQDKLYMQEAAQEVARAFGLPFYMNGAFGGLSFGGLGIPGGLTIPSHVPDEILNAAKKYSQQLGVDVNFILAVAYQESTFNIQAIGPETSLAYPDNHAYGLMQLLPSTAAQYGVGSASSVDLSQLHNVDRNIFAGTSYLKYLLDKYDNDARFAAAAYNYGPGAVDGKIKQYGNNFDDIFQYLPGQTKDYVPKVAGYYQLFGMQYGGGNSLFPYDSNMPYVDPNSPVRTRLVAVAKSMLGYPYRFGGEWMKVGKPPPEIDGIDCSAYVNWIFINTIGSCEVLGGRTTIGMHNAFGSTIQEISAHELMPGDIGLMRTNGNVGGASDHVGMCVGKDSDGTPLFIHDHGPTTPKPGQLRGRVDISRLRSTRYGYSGGYLGSVAPVTFERFGRITSLDN